MKLPPYMKLALGFPGSPQRGVPHRASRMGDLDVRCLQRLRDAEEGAAAVIAAARARKTTRLKQVKAEAEVEIAAYRQQRETTFRPKLTCTPRGLRTVRTGHACQPPACCTYQRRRAACSWA